MHTYIRTCIHTYRRTCIHTYAEDPANVRKLLLTAEYNPAGVYQVSM